MMISQWRRELATKARIIKEFDSSVTNAMIAERLADQFARYTDDNQLTELVVKNAMRCLRREEAETKLLTFPSGETMRLNRYDHPPHLYFDSPTDVVFVRGDDHLPYLLKNFNDAFIQHMQWHKRRGNRVHVIHAGDYADNGSFSRHPKTRAQMAMDVVQPIARAFLDSISDIADGIYITRGNHDDWFARYLDGVLDINDYWRVLLGAIDTDKVKLIDSTRLAVHNCGTLWRPTHPYQYSKIPARNANIYTQKYKSNVITFHEHSLGVIRDSWNDYTAIACGMMADRALMAYINDTDNTHNVMKNSYVVLQNGKFEIMTPYREWQDWTRYDIDPVPIYEEEAQQMAIMTSQLDLMRYMEGIAA